MFALDDTIVAIATAAGRGGIGVVRISGPESNSIARAILDVDRPLLARRATFSRLRSATPASVLDEVVVTLFVAPRSYTGQDVVEISSHGSPVVMDGIVSAALAAGARVARPGEFTLRAFLNGKRDLVQAEAVADLVNAATPLQARVAFDQLDGTLTRAIAAIDKPLFDLVVRLEASLDFPDEGYHFVTPGDVVSQIAAIRTQLDSLVADGVHGRLIREGATVVIAGRTNVGKSSLFNSLVGVDRAIVTDVPGTTRDLVTERVDVEGIPITLVDTAGSRATTDVVEREGVERGSRARAVAALVLIVLDGSEPLTCEDVEMLNEPGGAPRIVVLNKRDRGTRVSATDIAATSVGVLEVSARSGTGLSELRHAMVRAIAGDRESLRESVGISNARHIALMKRAQQHLQSAHDAVKSGGGPEEFVLVDLQAARQCFDEVVGVRTADDVLEAIFARFCIGK